MNLTILECKRVSTAGGTSVKCGVSMDPAYGGLERGSESSDLDTERNEVTLVSEAFAVLPESVTVSRRAAIINYQWMVDNG